MKHTKANSVRILAGAMMACAALGVGRAQAPLSSVPSTDSPLVTFTSTLYKPEDGVEAILVDGDVVYLGGDFTGSGKRVGHGVAIDSTTHQPISSFPTTDGTVYTAIADGSGGWYLSGDFRSVGSTRRDYLARVSSTGAINAAWAPSANGVVTSMAVVGSTVYVGGAFTSISGVARGHLAAIDATTGSLLPWAPVVDNRVNSIAVSGDTIYIGCAFDSVGGVERSGLGAISATTGATLPWNPGSDDEIVKLAMSNGFVLAAGTFSNIAGVPRRGIAELDPITGEATDWNANSDGAVRDFIIDGATLYVGGEFLQMGGQARGYAAALNRNDATATPWDPAVDGIVNALELSGSDVLLGGQFKKIGGLDSPWIGAANAAIGTPIPFSLGLSAAPREISTSGGKIYIDRQALVAVPRAQRGLAAFDATTGDLLSFNPMVDGKITAIAGSHSGLYVGGKFVSVGGEPRGNLAEIDTATGAVTPWNPNVVDVVNEVQVRPISAIALAGNDVYVAGSFSSIDGEPRAYVGSVDRDTGRVTPWNPNPNDLVTALKASSTSVYMGGLFTSIGGKGFAYLVQLGAASGVPVAWRPVVSSPVYSIGLLGRGETGSVGPAVLAGGTPVRAFTLLTGAQANWNPAATPGVTRALAARGNAIVIGSTNAIEEAGSRFSLGSFDRATGGAQAWVPNPGGGRFSPYGFYYITSVRALATAGSSLYVGGDFDTIGTRAYHNLALFDPEVAPGAVDFAFDDGAEGWGFRRGRGPFESATRAISFDPGAIQLTAPDNANTFTHLVSPPFRVGKNIASLATAEEEAVYRIDATVFSRLAAAGDIPPAMRLRASPRGFARTNELSITPREGFRSLAPATRGTVYTHYVSLPTGTAAFHAYFDLLSFSALATPGATIGLDRARVEAIASPIRAGTPREVASFSFLNGATNGFTFGSAAPSLRAPDQFAATDTGLLMRSHNGSESDAVTFGFWTGETSATFDADTLYSITWRIATDATAAQAAAIPTMRLRVNDSTQQLGASLILDSRPGASLPIDGLAQVYRHYLRTPPGIEGSRFLLSFDLIWAPLPPGDPSADDPEIAVILEGVTIGAVEE